MGPSRLVQTKKAFVYGLYMPYRESWGYGQFVLWKKCFCETPYPSTIRKLFTIHDIEHMFNSVTNRHTWVIVLEMRLKLQIFSTLKRKESFSSSPWFANWCIVSRNSWNGIVLIITDRVAEREIQCTKTVSDIFTLGCTMKLWFNGTQQPQSISLWASFNQA